MSTLLTRNTIAEYNKARREDEFDLKSVLIKVMQSTSESPLTHKKLTVETEPNLSWPQKLEHLRNAILLNLFYNNNFNYTTLFTAESFYPFFEMLKIDGVENDKDVLARHFIALHMSKGDYDPYRFVKYLIRCSTVRCNINEPVLEYIGKLYKT